MSEVAAPPPETLAACLDPGMPDALAKLPVGWYWTGGVCSVSCHASIGPDRAYIPQPMLNAFDDGFHADIDQPSTLSEALLDCIAQATAAIADRAASDGTFDQAIVQFVPVADHDQPE